MKVVGTKLLKAAARAGAEASAKAEKAATVSEGVGAWTAKAGKVSKASPLVAARGAMRTFDAAGRSFVELLDQGRAVPKETVLAAHTRLQAASAKVTSLLSELPDNETSRRALRVLIDTAGPLGSRIERSVMNPEALHPGAVVARELEGRRFPTQEAVAEAVATLAQSKQSPVRWYFNDPLVAYPGEDTAAVMRRAEAISRRARSFAEPAWDLTRQAQLRFNSLTSAPVRDARALLAAIRRVKGNDPFYSAVAEVKTEREAALFLSWARSHLFELGFKNDPAGFAKHLEYYVGKADSPHWPEALVRKELGLG